MRETANTYHTEQVRSKRILHLPIQKNVHLLLTHSVPVTRVADLGEFNPDMSFENNLEPHPTLEKQQGSGLILTNKK